ncbi:hypothetical protein [Peribacillus butanolivorans]|uniref:hypothetical protein n=1 Tax=Peribacillus butanolivorans TaxID=421767 RepID=UPI0013C376BD|nr:hypothetical protein [Peribacillus butanolivorans]
MQWIHTCRAQIEWYHVAIGISDTLVKQGKRVPEKGLQVGDLIYFDSYKKF